MGKTKTTDLKVRFDGGIRLQFHGAKVTSDAGLVAVRELDRALGLTEVVGRGCWLRGWATMLNRPNMSFLPDYATEMSERDGSS